MTKNSNNRHAEYLNRYSIIVADIKYLKDRQWTITYYLLLLYAAIIGFFKLMKFDEANDFCCGKTLLTVLILLVAVLGTVYQFKFQSRITDYRKLLKESRTYFSSSFRNFDVKAEEEKYTSWWNGFWLFTFPFIIIFWVSAGLVIWYFFQ